MALPLQSSEGIRSFLANENQREGYDVHLQLEDSVVDVLLDARGRTV
jgi:hypothetical protein